MNESLTYEERPGPDGQPISVPVVPANATMQQIEAIVSEEGAAIMTDAQQAAFNRYVSEGVSRDGRVR